MEHQLATQSTQKEQLQKPASSSMLQPKPAERAMTHPVLQLQRAIGNQAVQHMVRSGGMGLQNRPNIHGFGPKAQTPASPTTLVLQRKCACGGTAESLESTEECAECKAEREATVQRSANNQAAPSEPKTAPPIVHDVLRSPGHPLDGGTRSFMEPRFGHDLSQVRVHTDKQAAESAQAVGALAYTVGRDVVFGIGQYAPETSDGKRLMAHELAHVVQQQGNGTDASIKKKLLVGIPGDAFERQADAVADRVTGGDAAAPDRISATPAPTLQRVSLDDVWEGAKNVASSVEGAVTTAGEEAWEGAKNVASSVEGAATTAGEEVWKGAKNVASSVEGAVTTAGEEVWKGAKSVGGAVVSAGEEVWKGIKNVASSAGQTEGSQPPPDKTFWERCGSQIAMLKRMYNEQRYGCWCGPGNVCEEERDNIDACCKRHDLAYLALGVSGSEPEPGQVSMWSIEGFRRTMLADLLLVGCLQVTAIDLNFYGPAAALYRSGAQFIFGTRAAISAWIIANIPAIPIPIPIPGVGPSPSNVPQQPLVSIPDREVPMLSQEVAQQARDLMSQGHNSDALHVIVDALVINGFIDASLCNYSYVARTDQGEGLTNTNYKKDPAGTGQSVPDGLSEVEIYTPAFSSLSWLVSSIMHEYQHVLQGQKAQSPESFKEPKSSEDAEADEVEAYLWEIENSDITGLVNDIPQLWRVANRLTDHYNTLGGLNKDRQKTYRVRYEASMQFMQDLMGDDPPPLPPYQNIFHHGTDMDKANRLLKDDIEPLGGDDFGRGFYTHTRENWIKAREWAVQRARRDKKPGWGVVTFPVPDDIWEEEIFVALVFKDRFDRPGNAPINPETGQPMNWKEFVRYNKTHKDPLPEWKEFQIIQGPLWGPRISKSQLRQVIFTSSGVPVLNRGDVKELRMAVIRKFRR